MPDNIPLGQWSGSDATNQLHETIKKANAENAKANRTLLRLTWVLVFLTIVIVVLTLVLIFRSP